MEPAVQSGLLTSFRARFKKIALWRKCNILSSHLHLTSLLPPHSEACMNQQLQEGYVTVY